MALSDGTSNLVRIAALLGATLAHALGEILESASGVGRRLRRGTTWPDRQYQGAYPMGRGLGDLAGPMLLTTVAVNTGWAG
ncbi:hypothetical protein [Micromonospora sp. NPDC050495]|uniref:hypothetical protein n=1 Tax=Micromonospora sp. NPDC050495 TaxID=3154936 RepID=UPI0033CBC87D